MWETFPTSAGTLPLKLISFTGQEKNNFNVVQWKTENEENTKDFEMLRSFDGRNFELIGKVIASGNSAVAKSYQFTDIDGITPNTIYYYRLKMNDIDGKNSYSNNIKLQSSSFNSQYVNIYPNPVAGSLLNLTVYFETTEKATVQMISSKGELAGYSELALTKGPTKQIINVDDLTPGIYIIKLTMADGTAINKQVIIQ